MGVTVSPNLTGRIGETAGHLAGHLTSQVTGQFAVDLGSSGTPCAQPVGCATVLV